MTTAPLTTSTTTPVERTPLAIDEVDRLAAALNECFETLDVPDGLFTDDAFFDLLPPYWRFQLQGPAAFGQQLRAIARPPVASTIRRVVATTEGFVMEHVETHHGPPPEIARRIWVCDVDGGRISATTCYCNGGWDDDLRARHAAEAPMLRW